MKIFLTLLLPTLIIATGVSSILFFEKGNYTISALLTLASFLSASLWVYILDSRKPAFA